MKQRAISSGAGPGGGGIGSRLRAFDLYRKVPKDLTEATALGGTISVMFSVMFLMLFVLEVRNFMSVSEVTSIEIDHSEDGIFQINFNLTLSHIGCEFASIDLNNVIGKKRDDITDRTVHKYSLDGTFQGYVADDDKTDLEHLYEGTDKDHYGNTRHAIELSHQNFNEMVDKFEVLLVDFHAPWCVHCRNLSPIYEHAADLVKQRAPFEIDGHHKHSMALATFDCTVPAHRDICIGNHIQAFPTILVFRQSKNNVVTGPRGKYYEAYNGKREAVPIADFAISVLQDVQKADPDALAPLKDLGKGHDANKDGVLDSKISSRGCRIDGYLMVQRVPGQIIFRTKSSGHSFNTGLLNMDHKIDHLSFGNRSPHEIVRAAIKSMEGAYSDGLIKPIMLAEPEEEIGFTSDKPNATFEHYIKVVSKTRVPLRGKQSLSYEYTINSHTHKSEHGVPEIVISYDLSPLRVQVTQVSKPWIDGLTGMCAILGGVYTCSVIFEALFSGLVFSVAKKLD